MQAAQADGFPWASWSGSLNLFVWLVVGAYLIWGCKPRYRLLGLAVMPLATVLLAVSYAGGGTTGETSSYSSLFLVLHVGLVLAAFAGFTLAAGLSALYLWQERRLKRHEARILRVRVPALVTLDDLAGRTIAFALPALTLGIVAGLVRLGSHGGGFDALMAVTIVTWARLRSLSASALRGGLARAQGRVPAPRRVRARDRRSARPSDGAFLVTHPATSCGRRAISLRHAASSVAPVLTSTSAPSCLACCSHPTTRQCHRAGHP